jgi:hypothetical protein
MSSGICCVRATAPPDATPTSATALHGGCIADEPTLGEDLFRADRGLPKLFGRRPIVGGATRTGVPATNKIVDPVNPCQPKVSFVAPAARQSRPRSETSLASHSTRSLSSFEVAAELSRYREFNGTL